MIFNGEQLFALPIALLGQPNFRDAYYKNKKEKTMRSNELAQFTYKTFCLNLDLNYGLKESHFVTSNFDDYFTRLGLKEDLLSLDTDKSTQAMVDLVSFVFDDGHSSFAMSSFNNPEPQVTQRATSSAARDLVYSNNIKTLLEKYQIEPEVPSYTEVGDTAFVYFQRFNVVNPNFYSPETVPSEENMWFMLLNDTLGLVQHAHHMITRENSPIKNVVIDLSNNIGGAIDAAAYVATWLTGENLVLEGQVRDFIPGQISYVNKCTNATLTQGYLADINLDHKFDDKDVLSTYNKNIYCLTSKSSFSCGNLIPSILKDTKKATLIGQTTGGVTCAVFSISTADGTILNISGPYQLSSVKNGSYYSIDQGITPDVFIRDLKELYENDGATPRGKIINLIKGLK